MNHDHDHEETYLAVVGQALLLIVTSFVMYKGIVLFLRWLIP